uniref:Uncharacterized protein n=1 Tax=Daphnia magna TaxID=35525 RepID=A0A0P6ITB5_9CRUS
MNMTSKMAQSRPTTAPPITAVNKRRKHSRLSDLTKRIRRGRVEEHQEQRRRHIHTIDIPKCIGACLPVR